MYKLDSMSLCTVFVIAALLVAAAASPNLRSAGDTTNSNPQYSRKLLKGTDDAEAPSPAEALAPMILAFMGIDNNGTDAAGNGTAGSQGHGDGDGDGGYTYPPWDYCGSIRCPKYPTAAPVEGEVAAADSIADRGAPSNNAGGAAAGAPDSAKEQGPSGQSLETGSVTTYEGPRQHP